MKQILIFILLFLLYANLLAQSDKNNIAVTIDDLPVVTSINNDMNYSYIINHIIDKCKKFSVPATGFLVESSFTRNNAYNSTLKKLMEEWVDRGLTLGNHTYGHKSLNQISLDEFKNEVINGEKTLNEILGSRNQKIKYFRHPYLHTGLSLGLRDSSIGFLEERGYKVAPVTIDTYDWLIARAYEISWGKQDTTALRKISNDYIEYIKKCIVYYQEQSQKLMGRNVNQILLLHANRLNADNLDKVFKMIKELKYNFISLNEALQDDAYSKMKDTFIKNAGISWLHRWAIAEGKTKDFFAGEPEVPQYIRDMAKIN